MNQPIDTKRDLVIFDEIQECPNALTSLKYFQEDLPELALCSAGSLLGVHLTPISFPVGKVDMLTMYPMSFEEFLEAINEQRSLSYLKTVSKTMEIPEIVHEHLWTQLKIYFVVGGLPEVVDVFRKSCENLFLALKAVREKQTDLISNYYADMAKHSGKVNALHLERVWKSIPFQLAKSQNDSVQKFQFKGVLPGVSRYNRLVNVIDWLAAAGLIIKVSILDTAQIPLVAYAKENVFKLFCFDIGILGALSDLTPKIILDYDYGSYKGYFAENFVAQEFMYAGIKHLFSWQEKTAEIEFLIEEDGDIIPIEVKSGCVTKAKSLQAFIKKYHPSHHAIFSANNFSYSKQKNCYRIPLYLAAQFIS